MKLKPLDRMIKSHYRRCCPLCKGILETEVLERTGRHTKHTRVTARIFNCQNCPSSYCYERVGSHFMINTFDYRMDKYSIHCVYEEDAEGFTIVYDPDPDKSWVDNITIAESDKIIPFPSTREKLEDRIQTYIIFS